MKHILLSVVAVGALALVGLFANTAVADGRHHGHHHGHHHHGHHHHGHRGHYCPPVYRTYAPYGGYYRGGYVPYGAGYSGGYQPYQGFYYRQPSFGLYLGF
jgi:hypothetical protein